MKDANQFKAMNYPYIWCEIRNDGVREKSAQYGP